MKCYIFNSDIGRETSVAMIKPMLDEKNMKIVGEKARQLAAELEKSGAKSVRIYGSNESTSNHIVSILVPVFEKQGLMQETDAFLSDDFAGRDYGKVQNHSRERVGISKVFKSKEARSYLKSNLNLENSHGIEKKGDYEQRVFESIFSVIAGTPNETAVVLVVGDEFIKTCQKNPDIHSMMYFGDEHLIDPSLFRMRHHFMPYNSDMISSWNDVMVNESTLKSRMDIPYLGYAETIIEAPEVSSATGYIQPVYLKYAQKKLDEEIKQKKLEENAVSSQK